jgi:hypothetical protein
MIRAAILPLLCGATLAGCGNRQAEHAFDGQYFRARAAKVGGDVAQIEVSVRPVSVSFRGALEAGRYEATRYCVTTFGNSEIDWLVGPDQAPQSYVIDNDTLVLRGICEE